MVGSRTPRKDTLSTKRADAIFGYLIPLFFIFVAAYQQIVDGKIDKFILGFLLIIGVSALGWRLDVFFDTYMKYKFGSKKTSDNIGEQI